jgi:SlyX protein
MRALFCWEKIMSELAARIEVLEVRIAHQDKSIGDLGDMITAQWKKIEGLERLIGRLSEEIEQMDQLPAGIERPPHY